MKHTLLVFIPRFFNALGKYKGVLLSLLDGMVFHHRVTTDNMVPVPLYT